MTNLAEEKMEELYDAVWKSGYRLGDRHGHKRGFKEGRSTLSNMWYVVVFLVGMFLFLSFGFGAALVTGVDYLNTETILEEKQ